MATEAVARCPYAYSPERPLRWVLKSASTLQLTLSFRFAVLGQVHVVHDGDRPDIMFAHDQHVD